MWNAARPAVRRGLGWIGLTLGVAAIAIFRPGVATAMTASASSESQVRVPPHSKWTTPDGMKIIVNNGSTYIYVTLHYHYLDLLWIDCAIPLNGDATLKGFGENNPNDDSDNDTIRVHGTVHLDDCDGTNLRIKKGGTAECEDCDQNNIEFGKGGGTLSGEHNDGNTITGSKTNNADTSRFHGNKNTYVG